MAQLLDQIRNQYHESQDYFRERKLRQVKQLQLLNNLRRADENIASTLLFSFFHRVLSNLYEAKIQVKFVPLEEIDQRKINSLNKLAVNDFMEMDMGRIQYDWTFDTLFFSRGYLETAHFDKKRKILKPRVLNPLACGTDPFFSEPQEWRYYWKWVLKSGWEIQNLIKTGVIDGITDITQIPSGLEEELWDYKVKRDQAKRLTSTNQDSPVFPSDSNGIYQILEIYTTDENGEKIVVWVDKNFSHILLKEKLDLRDGEGGTSKWPIVTKELFREPHSGVSFSIPDIIEDKHRAESVLLNLIYMAAKDEANPLYEYVPDNVKDVTQLFQRQIKQHIPVEVLGQSIQPLRKDAALSNSILGFINILRNQSQDPIGSGMTFEPVKKGKNTATEAALQQQMIDLSQSLQSKVLQIGEQEFWSHWYQRYLRNTKEGDKKVISLMGVKSISFEELDLGDIRTNNPPKVIVMSAKEAEFKELVNKRDMMQVYPQLAQTMDMAGFRNFNKYIFMPKFVEDTSTLDLVLPKSIDELKAEEENEMLNKDKMPDVEETDDHETHLYVHASAKNTPATITHRYWHEKLLALKKKQLEDMQMAQGIAGQGGAQMPGQMQMGSNQPQETAIPMEKEMQRSRTGKNNVNVL